MPKYKMLCKLNNSTDFNKKIYGFDIETSQPGKEIISGIELIRQDFLCGSIVGDDGITEFFKDKNEMADFMVLKRFRNCNFYATNLEFDFIHIFENTKHFKNFKIIDRNGIIYAKYLRGHADDTHFIDTWNYTGKIKVEQMGSLLGINKLPAPVSFKKIPQNQAQWDEMRNYNINDSLITYKFADFFCRDFCKKINAKPKITLASTGLDFWRRNYLDRNIFQEPKFMIETHYKGSIHGGRTEVLRRGLINHKFWVYDFNSHYPACCFNGFDDCGSYPLPSSSHYCRHITPGIIDSYEGITKCAISAPLDMNIPILGLSDVNMRYIFPVGKITAWFTNYELRKALDNGYKLIDTYEGIFYHDTFKPFRKAVKFLYAIRKKYKDDGNELMSMMTKTLMNSALFGKFAQQINNRHEIVHENNIRIDDKGILYALDEFENIVNYDTYAKRGDVFICSKKAPGHIPCFIMPILASYTTAIGRFKLWQKINKHAESMIYHDTDSLFTDKKCFSSGDNLGDLKLEYQAEGGIFIKPKMYYIKKDIPKYKIKGLGKKPTEDIFNDILNMKHIYYDKFSRFKESRVRKIPFSSIFGTDKHFSLEDTKRLWAKKFNPFEAESSKPLII